MDIVASVLSTLYGPALSHWVNGISQPPKNSVAVRPLTVAMLAYSAMKNIENFMPLYSVWYPATSSDSASGKSNGNRLVSAKAATRNVNQATVSDSTFQPMCDCCCTIVVSETLPASRITGIVDNPIAIS